MTDIDFDQARYNMIEQQIRPWEVLDQSVLDAIAIVPREDYVPMQYINLAFTDMEIPLGHSETMMSPKLEARMLQALAVEPNDTVLEVGTGSGYVTALLAELGRHVYSVDINQDLSEAARRKLTDHEVINVTLEVGDAAQGWDRHGPYDVIAITGSMPVLPATFEQSLKVGGRLFAVIGDSPVMEATLITRLGENEFRREMLFETDLPPLKNAPQPNRFQF
jgi:protein-L-isoaspartate(D-aspartate) O-methyltransferase